MQVTISRWLMSFLLISAFLLGGCSSGAADTSANSAMASPVAQVSPTAEGTTSSPANTANIPANLPRLEGEATVEMMVKGAKITIQVDGTNAPVTAGNFVDLVNRKVYDGLVFHRVERNPQPFVVQGGDPQSKDPTVPAEQLGTGGYIDPATNQERTIPLEIKLQNNPQPLYSLTVRDYVRSQIEDKIRSGELQNTEAAVRNYLNTLPPLVPVLRHTRGAIAMARSQSPDSASSQFYFALSDLNFLDGNYAVFGYVTDGMPVVDQIQRGDRIESARVTAGLEHLRPGQ